MLSEFVAAVRRSESRSLVVRGEAGSGKTALLAWAMALAADLVILHVCGVEVEIDLPFGAIARLLQPLRPLLTDLDEGSRAVLEAVLNAPLPEAARDQDRFAVGAAMLRLVASFQGAGLLIVVDDAQWIDQSSRETLGFLARRLDADNVGLLVAGRTATTWTGLDDLPTTTLTGLADAEASELLGRLGVTIEPSKLSSVLEATGGNPLALVEAVPALEADEYRLHEPIPISDRLRAAFATTFADLHEECRLSVLVASVLEDGDPRTFEQALGHVGLRIEDCTPAEDAGLISLVGGRPVFRHPLIRSAVAHSSSKSDYRRAHRAVAAALASSPAGAAGASRAWHLAAGSTGIDDEVADLLEHVARQAAAVGAFASAGQAYKRAAELSGDPAVRLSRFVRAASEAFEAGEPATARRLLRQAELQARDAHQAFELLRIHARIDTYDGHPIEACDRLATAARAIDDEERRGLLLSEAAGAAIIGGDAHRALNLARAAMEARPADPLTRSMAEVTLAGALIIAGDSHGARPLLAVDEQSLSLMPTTPALFTVAAALSALRAANDDLDDAERLVDLVNAPEYRISRVTSIPMALVTRTIVRFRRGDWNGADAAASLAIDLSSQTGNLSAVANAHAWAAMLAAGRGDAGRNAEHVHEGSALCRRLGLQGVQAQLHGSVGMLELGLGRPHAAIDPLERSRHICERLGLGNLVWWQWAPDLVEALALLRKQGEAHAIVDAIGERVGPRAEPFALALYARSRALAAGDDEAGRWFAQALAFHQRCPRPFEQARTQLCHGEWLRRQRQLGASRRVLESALAAFTELGADGFAERARRELAATGARLAPQTGGPAAMLTAQELQVALALTAGATTKEAASALFISPKTVEHHLRSTYRKFGINNRTALKKVLADTSAR